LFKTLRNISCLLLVGRFEQKMLETPPPKHELAVIKQQPLIQPFILI
jgi:hypothetical protein